MRAIEKQQRQLGETEISKVTFDPKSRDDIPQLLRGLQHIYCNPEIREEVFKILETAIPEGVDRNNGRPGMELWKIFVLGTLRLNLNCDYDRVHELANNHRTLRQMLGHGMVDNEDTYNLQTIKDNVSLLTPEVLDKINQVVVKAGHTLVKKEEEKLRGRCDSFVVKTDVHYPTDINLLYDAARKVIQLIAALCLVLGLSDWRKSAYNIRQIKNLYRKAQKLKLSTSKDPEKQAEQQKRIVEAHQNYLNLVISFLEKAEKTLAMFRETYGLSEADLSEIQRYMDHALRQIDQIVRRVLKGETIPHEEKVFSVFEEHTEWVSKGKAGVPVELGLRVCIVEDQHGFILHHNVMEKQTDDEVAVSIIEQTQARFPELIACSFDKGFHSPCNQEKLQDLLDFPVLPRKGKLSKTRQEIESSEEFVGARRQHSAVESAINALEVHGLDRCPDHGIHGFKRYVALAVVGRNIQRLGALLRKREAQSRRRKMPKAA
jgi:hypothetical protein